MFLCQRCGKDNREQARFCGYCGHPLDPVHRLSFHGSAGSLFGIYLVNIFLTICTLGIYRFWGKVRVQRYLLSQTEFATDRFAYHGSGLELLIGFLKVALVFGVPSVGLSILQRWPGAGLTMQVGAAVISVLFTLVFLPIAIVGVHRYRLSRTSWRGIRFSFRGRTADFLKLFVKGTLLTIVTLGLYYPSFTLQQYRFLTAYSYCGNQPFQFDGQTRDLWRSYGAAIVLSLLALGLPFVLFPFSSYVLALLFTLPLVWVFQRDLRGDYVRAVVVALVLVLLFVLLASLDNEFLAILPAMPLVLLAWFWFFVSKRRYCWNHTAFTDARFHSTVTAGRSLLLTVENLLLLIATLGLGRAWVSVRSLHFLFTYLSLNGPLDPAVIQQEDLTASAAGAGFLSFLEMDFDLG